MDLILSLTHFCEVHGPTSIICSQVLPFSCSQCHPDSFDFSPDSSSTPATSHDAASSSSSSSSSPPNNSNSNSNSSMRRSSLASSRIEDHCYFLKDKAAATSHNSPPKSDYKPNNINNTTTPIGGAHGDTCASCSLTLPEGVSKQLPSSSSSSSFPSPSSVGASGTATRDGNGRLQQNTTTSPVLRSREIVHSCGNPHSRSSFHSDYSADDFPQDSPPATSHHRHHHHHHSNHNLYYNHNSLQQSSSFPESFHSSVSSDSSCHTHMLTYLSLRGPPDPADYALLRRSSIRTLSCELLPRGLSSGPLCFGDSAAGYTVAYIFRLPDPMARGKRRSYALVALAGKDAGRAFRACPIIWRAFGRIASGLVRSAEKCQEDEQRRREEQDRRTAMTNTTTTTTTTTTATRSYTPVSSFLTGRAVDPDGQLRRPGQIRARNLAQIVGNEYIFAELHARFVALLQQLGSMFGGVPISEERFVCSTLREEKDVKVQSLSSSSRPQQLQQQQQQQPQQSQPQQNQSPSMVSTEKHTSDEKKSSSSSSSPLKYDNGECAGMSNLDQSNKKTVGPKPIPIAPRRPVMA